MLLLWHRLRGFRRRWRWNVPHLIRTDRRLTFGLQQLLFVIHEVLWIKRGKLIVVFQGDRPRRTCRLAIAAENTTQHVHIEDFCIPLSRRNALLFGVLRCLNINSISWTGPCTEETTHAPFQSIIIAMQHMPTTKTRWQLTLLLWIRYGGWLLAHILQGRCHTLDDVERHCVLLVLASFSLYYCKASKKGSTIVTYV